MGKELDSNSPSARWQRLWNLYHEARDLDASRRSAFLEDECHEDTELRTELEELLAADQQQEGPLDRQDALFELAADYSVDNDWKPLQNGEILAQRFEIVRLIGKGGMGNVYEAHDRELGTKVALKTVRPDIAEVPGALDRFYSEINLARRVTHSNVCRIFDLFRHEGLVFLTMELLHGETLTDRILKTGPMKPSEALPIIEQVSAALVEAHKVGIVHRDLKTGNVMLVPENRGTRAVVTDFGLATTLLQEDGASSPFSRDSHLMGTPEFMSPEQLQGGRITSATDIYSFGILIYHMLTAKFPFEGDSPFEVATRRLTHPPLSPRKHSLEIEKRWEETILRCLEREPEKRFSSSTDVVDALQGKTAIRRFSAELRRKPHVATLAILLVLVGAVAAFISFVGKSPPGERKTLPFEERDWVLISAFDNRTGDPLYDGTLEYALKRELSNSRFVNVIPQERIADVLRLMKKPSESMIDPGLGREICLRDGGIRAMLTGRVEKLGNSYSLSVDLIEPASGATVANLNEEAAGVGQVMQAVRRLSNRVREALGEQLLHIRNSNEALKKVTTPSLRALRLFTQADLLISNHNSKSAEELLREAVRVDPDFASAYMHLAFTIRNQGRSEDEYRPFAERALSLADDTTERERYFIRAGYFSMMEQHEEAITNYTALLQLYPDHYWAVNNIIFELNRLSELRRSPEVLPEALPYLVRRADMRPDDFQVNCIAARALAHANQKEKARIFVQRVFELIQENRYAENVGQCYAWIQFYPVHELWLKGDVDGVLREIDHWARKIKSQTPPERNDGMIVYVGLYYLELGKLQAAEQVFRLNGYETERNLWLRNVKLWGVPDSDYATVLDKSPAFPTQSYEAATLARAGLLTKARKLLKQPAYETNLWFKYSGVYGELALAEGRIDEAISLFEEAMRHLPTSSPYFLSAVSLARAWERKGKLDNAREVLESASQQKDMAFTCKRSWMTLQLELAQLYRKLDRKEEADKIEDKLRKLVKYADPNFRIFQRLNPRRELASK